MTDHTHLTMIELLDHLHRVMADQFSDQIASIYLGDVGIYPPKAFQAPSGEQRAALVLSPHYDRLESRAPNAELRTFGIHVIVMVNMTPYFEAMPVEAFGERLLVTLTTRIRGFLGQDSQFDLGGRVLTTKVGDIQWNWMQRGQTAIRAAAVEYEAKVKVPRM